MLDGYEDYEGGPLGTDRDIVAVVRNLVSAVYSELSGFTMLLTIL